jgi:3-deoxy-7-phosphoheptulonate synthase
MCGWGALAEPSDKCDPAELIELIEVINPSNQPGKIMIIVRMGAELLRENLPRLISAVEAAGKIVVWQSDPMHGNTIKSESGYKTRPFERIRDELRAFFDVHEEVCVRLRLRSGVLFSWMSSV